MKARNIALAAAALVIAAGAGCGKGGGSAGGPVVAEVGGRKITAGDLLITYDMISPPNRPPFETLEDKKAFLETTISKEILMGEAKTRGLDTSPEVEKGVRRLRETELLKRMFTEKGQKMVEISAEEVEEFYRQTQAQLHLRDIWIVNDRDKAADVLKQIRAGADFQEMARKYSENDYAKNGGDMGWHPVSAPMLDFFSTNLKTMQPGDVSDLVPLMNGHHIIQLVERRDADMSEFEAKKMTVRQEFRKKKEAKLWKAYLEDLQKSSNVTPVAENIQLIKERARGVPRGGTIPFTDSDKALPLVSFTGGAWTIADLQFYLQSLGAQFQPNFDDPEFDPTTWLVTRATNQLVLKTAEQLGLDKEVDFQQAIQRERERLSLEALHADIIKGITVSEDEMSQLYDAKKDSLIGPATARVRYIFTTEQTRIDSAYAEIQQGKPFVDVVKRYSEDINTRDKGGVVDSLPQGVFNNPEMDNAIFSLAPEQISRPIAFNQAFYLFQMIEVKPGRPLTYEEARPKIEEHLRTKRESETFDAWLNGKRQALNIKIFDKALNEIIAEEKGAA